MPDRVVRVRISEFQVAAAPAALKVFGLGSCVAVAIWDPVLKLGGLAHILLPGPAPDDDRAASGWNENKYADHALPQLLRAMVLRGGNPERMVAKIAGGANMFSTTEGLDDISAVKHGIGERNVEAVKETLARLQIPLVAEDTGGTRGRTVTFETATGRFSVSNARGGAQCI